MGKSKYERVSWDINDLAFLIYADYRSVSRQDVAKLFSVSPASISQQMMKLKDPSNYGSKTQEKVDKAGILEMKVRSGAYPDHLKIWNEKITKITGITYGMPQIPEELNEDDQQEEEVVEKTEHAPLLQLTINTESVLTIIKAWRGIND